MTRITRIEVIDENGRSYVNWEDTNDVTLSYQDEGRTLKVFVNKVKPKPPEFLKFTLGPTLHNVIEEWWDDVFTNKETSLHELVDAIEEWLPKEQSAKGSQNAYVECTVDGFNDAITKIKNKLRNKKDT